MAYSQVSEELLHLRKRARRRLVGAVALVIFALTVLWTVMDNAPPARFANGNPVEIVSSAPALKTSVVAVVAPESQTPAQLVSEPVATPMPASAPVVAPAAPVAAPVASKVVQEVHHAQAPSVLPGKLVNRQSPPVKENAAPLKAKHSTTATPDPKKILEGKADPTEPAAKSSGRHYVQIGAFADTAKAQQLSAKLKAAGLPVLSEKIRTDKGELTRIRIGPAADAARAEAYRKKAESVGVSGKVTK